MKQLRGSTEEQNYRQLSITPITDTIRSNKGEVNFKQGCPDAPILKYQTDSFFSHSHGQICEHVLTSSGIMQEAEDVPGAHARRPLRSLH